MYIHVNGRNIEITDAIKAYVKEKVGKVVTHYDQIQAIDVVLTVIKNPAATGRCVAEVTCKLNAGAIHCQEEADTMYESIDLLADKLDRQVKKHKDKIIKSKDKSASIRTDVLARKAAEAEVEEVETLETEEEA